MRSYLIALGAVAGLMVTSGEAAAPAAATVTGGLKVPSIGVLAKPLSGTPHFSVKHANPVEQVRQLVQCGSTMYAVGSFSQILQRNHVFERHNVFSFHARPPFKVTSWRPTVRGTVNSITFREGRCSHAYIGGNFTSVNGKGARKIAELNTRTGRLVKRFAHSASAQVETLQAVNGRILVGGDYRSINGSTANPYMTSLNPITGRDDGFVHLRIRGNIRFPGVVGNLTHIYNQALSHSRKLDLVIGDFASVRGRKRQQMFMINVGGARAKLTGWRSPAFNGHCDVHEPLYVRAASWSPSDGRIYIASTGRFPHGSSPKYPLTGLCDVAAAFPAAEKTVYPIWKNYTGCDSLYSTAADGSRAYFGGHDRWSMNPRGCNFKGHGAITASGMEGLAPASGRLLTNKYHTAGYYERSRGHGADDMLRTRAGLWIASDNFGHSQTCGFTSGLSGICFLPNR
ncbi:MAG TPA: hypothetical protein VFB39_06250 [Solirubrobacteraceae bacterium]|nr:hypothetical protein [Solirubrobacteraceae bacterium]